MITIFENRCVLKTYLIVLIPIFNPTHKGGDRLKKTYEICITNLSYFYHLGIVFFAVYQRIRSKATSWAGPRLVYSVSFIKKWINLWHTVSPKFYHMPLQLFFSWYGQSYHHQYIQSNHLFFNKDMAKHAKLS